MHLSGHILRASEPRRKKVMLIRQIGIFQNNKTVKKKKDKTVSFQLTNSLWQQWCKRSRPVVMC